MVFFICNACGQSVKKNQVEKHYTQQCRNCEMLSCMDCGKDFWGDDYKTHYKCITEDEKYGGKDFKPKPGTNKGEVKQERWIELIKETIATAKVSKDVNNLLQQLITFENIPRKKPKFLNFFHNSFRLRNPKVSETIWEIFDKAQKKQAEEKTQKNNTNAAKPSEVTTNSEKQQEDNSQNDSKDNNEGNPESTENQKKEKKKKRKHSESEIENEKTDTEPTAKRKACDMEESENTVPKKKKKQDEEADEKEQEEETSIVEGQENGKPPKFKWKKIIKAVLRNYDDQELSIKKLRKKVLAEFEASGGDGRPYTYEELCAKFEKRLRDPAFKVYKDRVKLLQ